MEVLFTVIGCGDAFFSGGRGHTCFFIKGSKSILLDCGATALYGMQQMGIATDDIDTIVLTHFHGDHFAGLPFIILDAARIGRKKKLTLITPPGGEEKLNEALKLFYPGAAVLDKLNIEYLEFNGHQKLDHEDMVLESYRVKHSPKTLPHGLRLTMDGVTIAYTGDTEWVDEIYPIVADADLAICDCTFFKKEVKNHLNYATLKKHIKKFTCRQLLLTHFDDDMLSNIKKLKAAYCYDGLKINLQKSPPIKN